MTSLIAYAYAQPQKWRLLGIMNHQCYVPLGCAKSVGLRVRFALGHIVLLLISSGGAEELQLFDFDEFDMLLSVWDGAELGAWSLPNTAVDR